MGNENPDRNTRSLLGLPLELFQHIIKDSISVRGIRRGKRLALVNHFFADEVRRALFLHNLLDESLSLHSKKLPSFTAAYLEHCVNNEPADGNPNLLCIRRVAELLSPTTQEVREYVSSLCKLAAPNVRHIFTPHYAPWIPIDEATFSHHVQSAAVYMGNAGEFDAWGAPTAFSLFFGGCANLAAQYGSKETIEQYLRPQGSYGRCYTLHHAASHGRLEIARFIFNYQIEAKPWRFDPDVRSPDEFLALSKALRTPYPEVWEYIMDLHHQYAVPIRPRWTLSLLLLCAEKGWRAMARHLLEKGVDPNGFGRTEANTPLFKAAEKGYVEVVQLLLERGATIQGSDVKAAASHGHLRIVKLLLNDNPIMAGTLVAAARGGYGDVVKQLLNHGADANECEGIPTIGYAILAEHERMFRILLQHGASAPTAMQREAISLRAKEAGVESMLAYLDSWPINKQI